VLVMRYSRHQQQGENAAQYNPAVVVAMQELFKLIFCFVATTLQQSVGVALGTLGQHTEVMRVLVPAACFTLQNNILYVALSNLEPLVFQITYQIKTLLTALLSVRLLGRSFTRWQWAAQATLTLGVVLAQLDSRPAAQQPRAGGGQSLLIGLLAVLAAAASSSYASVYFERLLKERARLLVVDAHESPAAKPPKSPPSPKPHAPPPGGSPPSAQSAPSLWQRNIHLCMWTCTMNLLLAVSQAGGGAWRSPLHGFEASTWGIVVVNGLGGLLVAVVMKYADNILKGFATAGAIILTGLLAPLLGLSPAPGAMLLVGGVLVIGSLFLYAHAPARRPIIPVAEEQRRV